MTRQAYIIPQKKLVVFWTPKAACTTIVSQILKALPENEVPEVFASEPGGPRGWLRRSPYWINGREAIDKCENETFRSIALLRNPYDRLISAYINKFVSNGKKNFGTLEELEPFAQKFVNDLHSVGKEYKGISFSEFVNGLCDCIEERGKGEPQLDHHWNTQVPFYMRKRKFRYDETFKLPNSKLFFDRLESLLEISVNRARQNATNYNDEVSGQNLTDISSVELIGRDLSKTNFRDSLLLERVKKAYQIDYRYLNRAS